MPNRKFGLFFLLIKYWNITHIFTLILSTIKRKINWAAILLFRQYCILWHGLLFMFRQKCKNWKLKITFSAKTLKIVDRTNQEGGRGVYSHGNFFAPSALSPDPFPSTWIFFCFVLFCFFFVPVPLPPLPRYTFLKRRKREIIRIWKSTLQTGGQSDMVWCFSGLQIIECNRRSYNS